VNTEVVTMATETRIYLLWEQFVCCVVIIEFGEELLPPISHPPSFPPSTWCWLWKNCWSVGTSVRRWSMSSPCWRLRV